MSDLIKREDAIKALKDNMVEMGGEDFSEIGVHSDDIDAIINDIPTIEPKAKVVAQVTFDEEKLREIVKEAVERFKEEYEIVDRPQGEWIRTGRTNIYGGIEVQCSNCGDKVMVQHLEDEWYCRHCGADMGMKGADDEQAVEKGDSDTD